MAVFINQGTQTAVATDTVGTLNYQVIKLDIGTAGTSVPLGSANPMPVTFATGFAGENTETDRMEVMPKPYIGTAYSPSNYNNWGGSVTANVKATPGNLASFYATNTNGTLRYLHFYDTTTVPATGGTPKLSYPVAGGNGTVPGTLGLGRDHYSDNGLYFGTGIAYAWSTTQGTYTAATNTDHTINVTYY